MGSQNELVQLHPDTANGSYINFKQVPLAVLTRKTRLMLSRLLNVPKIISSDENLPRDWRGIAHLAGLGSYRLEITNHPDPMAKVLQMWGKEGDKQTATFYHLLLFLGRIDRWDVVDDTNESLVEDAESYLTTKQYQAEEEIAKETKSNFQARDDNILTLDDVERAQQGLPPQLYDAFVLFADEDIEFATELIERMENFGFKLCVKERDLIGGVSFEHEAILRLISERCNRLIVIVSPAFLKSSANAFFVNFAQALGIEQGRRKIVPCLYQWCILPPTLNFYFLLNYQKSGKLCNFWDKLKDSIKSTPAERSRELQVPSITITEVESSTCAITQSSTSEMTVQSIVPRKIPRKRRDKTHSPSQESLQSSSLSSAGELTNEMMRASSLQSQLEISMTASVVNLNEVQSSNSLCDMSSSSITLKDTSSHNGKKTKWYKQFFKSNPLSLLEPKDSNKPSKRKFFRKKVAVSI